MLSSFHGINTMSSSLMWKVLISQSERSKTVDIMDVQHTPVIGHHERFPIARQSPVLNSSTLLLPMTFFPVNVLQHKSQEEVCDQTKSKTGIF